MPQMSYGYAIGRVRVLEHSLIRGAALSRLSAAESLRELSRILTELGFGEGEQLSDIERLCDRRVAQAAALVRDISPNPNVTDCFLLKYDVMNLKVLIKSRCLGVAPDGLSEMGTIEVNRLVRAVSERSYKALPSALADALSAIEAHIVEEMDPLFVDATLDKGMYALINQKLRAVRCGPVERYFRDKADLTNIVMALRCARMGRDAQFARALMLSGGALDEDAVAGIASDSAFVETLTQNMPYGSVIQAAMPDAGQETNLGLLEKRIDDYLLGIIRTHSRDIDTVMPIIGYLIGCEREASAVRLLAIGKASGLPHAHLEKLLRETYI